MVIFLLNLSETTFIKRVFWKLLSDLKIQAWKNAWRINWKIIEQRIVTVIVNCYDKNELFFWNQIRSNLYIDRYIFMDELFIMHDEILIMCFIFKFQVRTIKNKITANKRNAERWSSIHCAAWHIYTVIERFMFLI